MSKKTSNEEIFQGEKNKNFLSIPAAAKYTSLSIPYLYKLTSTNGITHYKIGSRVLFLKEELDKFILNNRVCSTTELDEKVMEYSVKNER